MNNRFFWGFPIGIIFLVLSCATTSNGLTRYEQFSISFSTETKKAKENIDIFNNYVNELSDYEMLIGTLSDSDYNDVNKIVDNLPGSKSNMDIQIQTAKDIGNSVTSDGFYTDTGKKVRGWDNVAYTNLHVATTLEALDQEHAESMSNYNNIHLKLFEKPNKPFNTDVIKIFTGIRIDMTSAKSDIAANDWNMAKNNTNNANNKLKSAINLDLNNVELYQISIFQNELKNISNQITLGSAINTTGTILKNVGEGAAGILQGIGDVFRGIGSKLNEDK
jgi:hypothetical protein